MKKQLLEILACPIDKSNPLSLTVFTSTESGDIAEGLLQCPKCSRWYPVRDTVPELLPDNRRDKAADIEFLEKYKNSLPDVLLKNGVPFNLSAP